ncbi:MAG: AraC family transcriptional regulator [Flavobacteriaceae bacterium]|nr:AraC family transcriptional regulator [Flavobacteriaceae bacterium]
MIQDKISTFPELAQYAAWMNTSTKTLSRISKRYWNDTPANVIKKRKILEAKRLLANRQIQVKEVGYSLGFEEPSNFSKYFTKVVGMRPKEFQQQLP